MIFWTTGGESVDLGQKEIRQCEFCKTKHSFHLFLCYRYFALYCIFFIITQKKYLLLCSGCGKGREISAAEYVGKNPISLWQRFSLLGFIAFIFCLGIASVFESKPVKYQHMPRNQTSLSSPQVQYDPLPPMPLSSTWNYALLFFEARQQNQVHLRMIVVRDHNTALQILAQLKNGESFAKLAKAKSVHPSSDSGGDLGWVALSDLRFEFQAALRNTKPGGWSDIIQLKSQ
ncbi:MAG: hypothetical protein EHM72_11795 [Calditrichaeota bacterium]|nr:MAG: hypothetical protein EHM72_11795 [Calditrichota bacterium]